MEGKELVAETVIHMYTNAKVQEFLSKQPQERVHIMQLLWAWDDAKAKDVLQHKVDIGGQVVVEQNQGPCHLGSMSKGCETICKKAKSNVTGVLKEAMRKLMSVDNNFLLLKILKMA